MTAHSFVLQADICYSTSPQTLETLDEDNQERSEAMNQLQEEYTQQYQQQQQSQGGYYNWPFGW